MVQEQYNKRITRFLDEFEWYIEAFKKSKTEGGTMLGSGFIAGKQMDLV